MDCRHHPTCPGCAYLGRPYDAQLAAKADRLRAAFAHYPHLGDPGAVTGALHQEGYRHRLKLPVQVEGDEVAIGLYDRDGRVLDTPDCPVLEPGLRDALGIVRAWMAGRRGVHSLDLRRSSLTGEFAAVIACDGGSLPGGVRGAKQLMTEVPGLVSVSVSTADPERKRVIGDDAQLIAGVDAIDEAIGDTKYRLHAGAFFQVDPRNAVQVHDRVRALVGDAERVLDLYAGVGAYARMLAPGRAQVVAVEEIAASVKSAREGAPANLQVIRAKVETLDLGEAFDVAILNPARRGSDPATLGRIAKLAKRLIYVSCSPETLARDLDVLAAHGMRLRSTFGVDLFPQTPEVEVVVGLERGDTLESWRIPGGKATGPWNKPWSGALGRPQEVVVLVLGDPGEHGKLPTGRFRRIGIVATHALLRIELDGAVVPALAALARDGHRVCGRDPKTARYFLEKAGLIRPFVHIHKAGGAVAPLHGDLVVALQALGASPTLIARAGGPPR